VFAGMTEIRDFITVGTENYMTVLQGVVYKYAAFLTTTLDGEKSSTSLKLRVIMKGKKFNTLLESDSKSCCRLEHILNNGHL
jgi:hypothetical protein